MAEKIMTIRPKAKDIRYITPQPGPQTDFLTSPADIVIYGGAAGGGKTYGLLIEGARHAQNPKFGFVMFRRESGQIANEGGPWDTALDLYVPLVKNPDRDFVTSPKHIVKFKWGSKGTFSHMQLEKHMKQWDGSQIPLILWDELQHFTEKQFWYMLSRNRSTCGVRPYMRGTCNPDPDSFLIKLLEWWIYQDESQIPYGAEAEPGDPIPERSGNIRWFIRIKGEVFWADSREELEEEHPGCKPKSLTFIKSSLEDNQELLKKDPDYSANIEAMLDYERKRLKGNWFARPTAGELFKRTYFEIVDDFNYEDVISAVRYWDRAATTVSELNNDPDYTVGLYLALMVDGSYIIADIARDRLDPGDVEELIDSCVHQDEPEVVLGLEQEPGASGKMEVYYYEKKYGAIRDIHIGSKSGKNAAKLTCWKPVARYAKAKGIKILRADWNRSFLAEMEAVTDGTQEGHDDQADSLAGGFNYLNSDSFGIADGINVM
jgi:predicted phage terminase large subunit-like protein